MSVNTMRFRVRKAAGSPTVKGAGGIETLASHTCNPSAHPDYLRKGSLPQGFDRTEHLASKLDHCVNYLRRSEVVASKLDYERTKTMSLTDAASNYAATKGTLRYVVTSYVLNQVLTDLGLNDTSAFFKKSYIVTMSTTPPTTGMDSYVPGYDVFKTVYDKVIAWSDSTTGIEATYLKQTDAASNYLKLDDSGEPPDVGTFRDEIDSIKSQIGEIGFTQCTSGEIATSTNTYYTYDSAAHRYTRVAVETGTALTTSHYKRTIDDTVEARIAAISSKPVKVYPLTRKISDVSTACTLANMSSDTSKTSGGTYVDLELPSAIPVADINKYTYGILIKDNMNAVCVNPMVVYYVPDPDATSTVVRTTCAASCLFSTHSDGTFYFNPPYRWLFGPDNTWIGETTTGASNYAIYLIATPITYVT